MTSILTCIVCILHFCIKKFVQKVVTLRFTCSCLDLGDTMLKKFAGEKLVDTQLLVGNGCRWVGSGAVESFFCKYSGALNSSCWSSAVMEPLVEEVGALTKEGRGKLVYPGLTVLTYHTSATPTVS